jgi:hypothetical protein
LTKFLVNRTALLNQNGTVAIAFRSELQQQCSPGGRFSVGDQPFADQRLNGAMNDRAVQSEQGGNLILVQRGTSSQRRQNKRTGLRAFGFPLHAPGDVEVRSRQMHKNGVLEDCFGDEFTVREDHRMVTVDSSGRRHCG